MFRKDYSSLKQSIQSRSKGDKFEVEEEGGGTK